MNLAKKFAIIIAMAFAATPTLASDCEKISAESLRSPFAILSLKTVNTFFANYGVIGNWAEFQTQQIKVLSSQLTTVVSDHRGEKVYDAPQGYFQSLGDWSQIFSTGSDFRVEIVQVTDSSVTARLRGTVKFSTPIQGHSQVGDAEHKWTEKFQLGRDGKIIKFEVLMNLFQ
jgi:hypothetical protein